MQNCSFGYFVGGWGKPPVDETGRPLYGDVFGLEQQESGHGVQEEEEIDKSFWGELESEEEEEEEEEVGISPFLGILIPCDYHVIGVRGRSVPTT